MTPTLRVVLIVVSILTTFMIMRKIRQSKLQIEDSIFWLGFSSILIVFSIFPGLPDLLAELAGTYTTANFIYLAVIFLLIVKMFHMSIKQSQLETKVKDLAQKIAGEDISERVRQLGEAVRVGGVFRPDHQPYVSLLRQRAHGFLTVSGGIANVVFARADDFRKTRAQGVNHIRGIVDGERGLGHKRQPGVIFHFQLQHVFRRLDQVHPPLRVVVLSHGAFDFRMAGVADHDDFLAVVVKLDDLTVHFGDQGTRGVENAQRAGMRFVRDAAGNAVG